MQALLLCTLSPLLLLGWILEPDHESELRRRLSRSERDWDRTWGLLFGPMDEIHVPDEHH